MPLDRGQADRVEKPLIFRATCPQMWGRLATCAAVDYRRRSAANAAIGPIDNRPQINQSAPQSPCPSACPLGFSSSFAGGTPIPTGDKRGSPVPPYSYRSASMGSTEAALATLRGRAFLVVGLSVSGRTTRAGQRRSSLATIR